MEGLTIRKKVTPRAKPSKRSISDVLFSGVLVLLLIVLIPLILLAILFSFTWHKIFPEKPTTSTEPRPIVMHEVVNDLFPLRYHYVLGEEISEGATDYFDDEPLILYQSADAPTFFRVIFPALRLNAQPAFLCKR